VVVRRLLLDWRRQMYGKWRASAVAVARGPKAVKLEELMYRDGHTAHEAIEILRTAGTDLPTDELQSLADGLPARQRPRRVSDEVLDLHRVDFEDPVDLQDRRRAVHHMHHTLTAALRRLPAEDRQLIDLRYGKRHRVPALATMLQTDAKTLYRRCDRVLQSLRTSLEMAGVKGSTWDGRP
jgi:DNA-directed RNA polymerase specialized sigma24 family protein